MRSLRWAAAPSPPRPTTPRPPPPQLRRPRPRRRAPPGPAIRPDPASGPRASETSTAPATPTTLAPTAASATASAIDVGALVPLLPDTKTIGLPGSLPTASEDGDDASGAPFTLGAPAFDADAVVDALLAEPGLTLSPLARQDLADGRVNPQLTRLLLAATRRHTLSVSTLVSGHSLCVDGGNVPPCEQSSVSMHIYGRAVDITAVDGEPVSADSVRAWDLLGYLVSLPTGQRPNEIGVPWRALDQLSGIFSDADHDHHLHVAFEPDGSVPEPIPESWPGPDVCSAPAGSLDSTPGLLLTAAGQSPGLGGLSAAGDACGTLGEARAVDIATTSDCQGSWILDHHGGLHANGTAPLLGDASGQDTVALLAGPGGYRIVTSGGRVLGFGDRPSLGDAAQLADHWIVAAAETPGGGGYWLLADDGGVLTFGDALFAGSLAELDHLAGPVGIATTPSGGGYWILTADGGVFAFGDAAYTGNGPSGAVAIRANGGGYTVVTADGRLHGLAGGTSGGLDEAPASAVVSAAICS